MNEKRQLKFNKLLDLYKDKLNQFIINNKLDDSPEYVLNCILSADPDIIGKNSKWLINNTLNGNILWEDIEAGENSKSYDTLNRFLTIRKQFTDPKLRDINQFKRLGDIAQQLRGYEVIQSNKSIKNEEKQQIYSETEFLYNENGYLVISPKTERASCFWGLNTEWCTAATRSDNLFDYYNDDSPLYICILPNGRKYQFHNNSSPMDENDISVKNITNPILRQLAFITGQIDNIKEINYNNEHEAKLSCKKNSKNIQYVDSNLPYYEECCKLAVQQNGLTIQYIDKDISNYEEYCKLAIQQDGMIIQDLDKDLSYYKECCKLAVQQNGLTIEFIDKNLPYYEECCKLAVQQDGWAIYYLDKNISNYEECCKLAVQQDGMIIQDLDKDLPYYEELCKIAVQQDGRAIQFIDKNLPYYEECCKLAVQQDGWAIYYLDKNISNYEECCKLAVQQDGRAIQFIDKNLPYYEELCKIAVQQDDRAIQFIDSNLPYFNECYELSLQQIKEEVKLPKDEINRDFSEIKEILMNTKIPIIKKDKELTI